MTTKARDNVLCVLVLFGLLIVGWHPIDAQHDPPPGAIPLPAPPAVLTFRGGLTPFNGTHWSGQAGFDGLCEGLIRQTVGLLNARGQPLPVPVAQRIMLGGAVVGFTNPAGTYRAYNLDVTTFAVAFAAVAAGQRLYTCGHGVSVGGVKGGVVVLDSGGSFSGFAPSGTGVPGVAPYPALAGVPRAATARLHHCWTGRDPDDAGPRRSVAASLDLSAGTTTAHSHDHEAHNDLQIEVEDGPAAGAALQAQIDAALAAVPDLTALAFPAHYTNGQAAIDKAVPPLGGLSVVALRLTYADTGGGGDPPSRRIFTLASCAPNAVERTFVVNTAVDVSDGNPGDGFCDTGNMVQGFTGLCTLRAALSESDVLSGMQAIHFNIPGGGVPTIRPRSILGNLGTIGPAIVDGTTQPGGLVELNGSDAGAGGIGLSLAGEGSTVRGLVINGFASHGILIASTGEPGIPGGHLIEQSFIGTNATGTVVVPNGGNGVTITLPDNIVRDNVISGNGGDGVAIRTANATDNHVLANFIGTNRSGASLGNAGDGVVVEEGSTANKVGHNTIGFNGGLPIDLGGDGPTPNDGQDADAGANNLQNFPELTGATALSGMTSIQGRLQSAPNTNFILDFFSTASCSAFSLQTPLGSREVTTNSAGIANVALGLETVPAGQFITSTTAADEDGNTSEVSACVPIVLPPQGLSVWLNAPTYQAGRELVLTGALTPIAPPAAVDAYIVVRIPTGEFLSLQLSGAVVPGIVPIARNFVPFTFEAPLLHYTFTGAEPPGVYTWFAALVRPGTLAFVAPLDQKPFTVQ